MSASAVFHQFQCMSQEDMDTFLKFDLIGICIMICGSSVAPIYYTFMCEDSLFWCKLWLYMIFTLTGSALLMTLF